MIYHCIVYVPLIWTGHEQKEHILSNINSLKQMVSDIWLHSEYSRFRNIQTKYHPSDVF